MKKVDVGEFNNSIECSQFDEFKYFSAEQYYSLEAQKPPLESSSFNEDNLNKENAHSKNTSNVNKDNNFDEARKQYDNLNTSDGSQVPNNLGSSNSGSTFSSSSSTTSISSSTSGATTLSSAAATTSSVASIATSAVVAITAVTTFFTFQKEYVSVETGDDYSSITINIDDVIKDDKGLHSFSYDDFIIQFNDGEENRIINFEKGNHTYLVTGLEPNKTYSYDIICNNSSLEKDNVCFTGKVTTTNTKKPKCVYDELNNSITYDDSRKNGIINYSLYLSDYYNEYSDYSLYVCSEPQEDESDIRNVIFESNQLNKNNYFSGSIANITYDKVYLYVVGYNMKAECIYSETIDMNMPNEWAISKNPIIDFDENKVSILSDSNKIIVEGEYNSYDLTKNLEVYINQYDVLNNIIKEKQIVPLVIDGKDKKFSFVFDVMYGIDSFTYSIFYQSSSNRMINVYDSKKLKSNISLSFDASYNKVLPKDAIVTYSKDKIIIEVDPNYYSDNDNMYYRLEVLNSSGKVYGTYKGREKALFEISEYEGLDKIIFKYYDCSLYLGEEKVFETYLMDGCDFGYHVLDIVEEEMKEETSIDSIIVNGKQNNIDTTKNIKISFTEYDASMNKIRENEEIDINFLENKTFNAQFDVSYGIKKYDYVIYFYDELGNKIDLYRSEIKNFGINQEFNASYNKVLPKDAIVTYSKDKIIIEVDPNYYSDNDNMYYRLEVLNSSGKVYGTYKGREKALFEISEYEGLDKIIFKYYDCSLYLGEEKVFETYLMDGCDFGYHVLDIVEEEMKEETSIDSIIVNGKQNNIDTTKNIKISFTEYDASMNKIRENEEIDINFLENKTFNAQFNVSYGIKKYDYVIYFYDELGNKIDIYSSGIKSYDSNQEFVGSINYIEPNDSDITIDLPNVSISFDTGFTSTYDFMFYKVELYSSDDIFLDSYSGTSPLVTFEIEDLDGKLDFYYKYYKCATFLGDEIIYDIYTTEMNSLENFYFGIDEDSFLHTMDSTSIEIEGKMHGYNLYNGDLHIFVSEYIESGETIRFNEEFIPSINVNDQTFILTFDVSYGIKSFDYYICYEGEDLIEIYRSQKIDYNGNQEFNATYNKIEPKDAKIIYLSDGISIEIDTSFTSNKENLFYKVEVLNSLEEVLAYYEGVDKAIIKVTSIDALDKIFFRYTSCGTFNGDKHNFESSLTEGIIFSYPTLTFDEKAIHNGTNFEIGYSLNMAYDYSLATIELIVIKDDIEQANLSINSLKSNGTIDLGIVEELGAVSILSSITFKTYEGNIYTITNESITCDLLYSFEVKKMEIDGTDYSDNMPMTIFFDNKIPSSYKLHITDKTNGIDELINSTDVYYRVLNKNNEYTINIQAEDSEGNSFGNLFSYNISLALANDNYIAPTYMNSPNPGDATVTYNEDGTINMYRKVSVEGLPENEYINAFIYSSCTNDAETGRPIYENGYDIITRSEYANIENIPFANYIFKYYEVMEYNGITYLIACNWPSGMVEPANISATATSSSDGEKTVISVTILNSYNVINKINVDGVDYEYTSYENQYDSNPQLILDGNIEINQITIYLKDYYNDYDTFSNEIEIKGSPEMEITINMLT